MTIHWLDTVDDPSGRMPDTGDRSLSRRLRLPSLKDASLSDWISEIARAVLARPGAVLVGRGLPALTLVHLSAERPELPVGAVVMVSPADVEQGAASLRLMSGFAPIPIAPFAYPAVLVTRRSDRSLRAGRARVLARMWEVNWVVADGEENEAALSIAARMSGGPVVAPPPAPRHAP